MLFELATKKKRQDALQRLSHRYLESLRIECMIEIPKSNSEPEGIARILKQHGAEDSSYSISWVKRLMEKSYL